MAFKPWAKKLLKVVVIVEVVYVVLINTALQLPLTQTLINGIKPEKFHISWENAWSFYPFRVHVTGGFGSGQSRSQQWQFAADSVSGSISILPLVFKRVWIRNVSGSNIDYWQRPRLKEERDVTHLIPYFPDIEGWDISEADTSPRKQKRPWFVSINDITVSGSHSIWIWNVKGKFDAEISGELAVRSRGGPLSLDVNDLALDLGQFTVNGDTEIFESGQINGSMGFAEFVPRENKGAKMLPFLILDLEVDIDLNDLSFINLFTQNFEGMNIGGSGQVNGRLRYDQGNVLASTDLEVDADNLHVTLASLAITGDGEVSVRRGPETDQLLDLAFQYRGLEVSHLDDSAPLLTGQGFNLHIGGDGYVITSEEGTNPSRTLAFSIDGLTVPDLALFQRYLPEKWPFKLHGGAGTLAGHASLAPNALSVDLRLQSDEADMGIKEYRFDTDLDAVLRLENPSIMSQGTLIGGTYIALTEARLNKEGETSAETWRASISLNKGELSLINDEQKADRAHAFDLFKVIGQTPTRDMLGTSRGLVGFEASVSSLAWLSVFLSDNPRAKVGGQGNITGDVFLEAGMPGAGTSIDVVSEALSIDVLDYVSSGDGRISLDVEEGGDSPDWSLEVMLDNGAMRRQGEATAGIQDVEMVLSALVKDVTLEPNPDREFLLAFKIPSARVVDMTVFNGYLPPDGPMRFTAGTADLSADIELQREDADGWMKLVSNGLEAEMDGQLIQGDLGVNLQISDGVPADMMFDISNSSVNLDNVRVAGEASEFDQENWSAEFTLVDAQTVFHDPLQLDADAELVMSDSRPIVAVFNNSERPPPKFIANMLTIEDIEGTAQLRMKGDRVVIPFAHAISDNIEVGAKGVIEKENTNGMFYARYKKLGALVKIRDGKKNIDIINARKKFDEYEVQP